MQIFPLRAMAKGRAMKATTLRVDVQIGWRNSRAKPCTHTSIVTPRPFATQPLGIVATDSFLITWRISPSMGGGDSFLPCGFMPKWLSSNLLFPDSLYHVGGVWFIGRLVTRCDNNDIELTSLKPLNHWRTTVVQIWSWTWSHLHWPAAMKNQTLASDSLHTRLIETQSESGLATTEVQRMAQKAFPPPPHWLWKVFC